jgi:hypothetical protein
LPDGGGSYDAGVCTDNFVEERWDRDYTSSTVPSIVRCQGMYKTEYRDRMNSSLPAYREKIAATGLVAKVTSSGQDYRNSRRIGYHSDYMQYARDGFVRGALPLHCTLRLPFLMWTLSLASAVRCPCTALCACLFSCGP